MYVDIALDNKILKDVLSKKLRALVKRKFCDLPEEILQLKHHQGLRDIDVPKIDVLLLLCERGQCGDGQVAGAFRGLAKGRTGRPTSSMTPTVRSLVWKSSSVFLPCEVRILKNDIGGRGKPEWVWVDHGPEFLALDITR